MKCPLVCPLLVALYFYTATKQKQKPQNCYHWHLFPIMSCWLTNHILNIITFHGFEDTDIKTSVSILNRTLAVSLVCCLLKNAVWNHTNLHETKKTIITSDFISTLFIFSLTKTYSFIHACNLNFSYEYYGLPKSFRLIIFRVYTQHLSSVHKIC